jgi:hypothetical protein
MIQPPVALATARAIGIDRRAIDAFMFVNCGNCGMAEESELR